MFYDSDFFILRLATILDMVIQGPQSAKKNMHHWSQSKQENSKSTYFTTFYDVSLKKIVFQDGVWRPS